MYHMYIYMYAYYVQSRCHTHSYTYIYIHMYIKTGVDMSIDILTGIQTYINVAMWCCVSKVAATNSNTDSVMTTIALDSS